MSTEPEPPFQTEWHGHRNNKPIWLRPATDRRALLLAHFFRMAATLGYSYAHCVIWAGYATTDAQLHSGQLRWREDGYEGVLKRATKRLWNSKNAAGWHHAFWMHGLRMLPELLPPVLYALKLSPNTPWQIAMDYASEHEPEPKFHYRLLEDLTSPTPPWKRSQS